MDLSSILNSKNRCLKKLSDLTKECIFSLDSSVPLEQFDFDEFFIQQEKAWKAFLFFNKKINNVVKECKLLLSNQEFSQILTHQEMQQKEITVIMGLNDSLIQKIELEKKKLKEQLISSEKNRCVFTKFKSRWIQESGEKLDGIL